MLEKMKTKVSDKYKKKLQSELKEGLAEQLIDTCIKYHLNQQKLAETKPPKKTFSARKKFTDMKNIDEVIKSWVMRYKIKHGLI